MPQSGKKAGGIQQPHLKIPPYSKPITRARRAGLVPKHLGLGHIIIVFEWRPKYLSNLFPYIVMPPGEDPQLFDWSFCAGLDICIVCTDAHPVWLQRILAKELFSANIGNLKVLNIDGLAERREGAWLKINQLFPGHPNWKKDWAFDD